MRSFLLLALVALLAAQVQADTVSVITYYNTANCTGTPTSVQNFTTVQKCTVTSEGSSMTFYNSDATQGYVVQYAIGNANCSTDNAYAIQAEYPNPTASTCIHSFGSVYYTVSTQIVQPQIDFPFSFPPDGWAVSSQYKNKTDSSDAQACSGDGVYLGSQTAFKLDFCQLRTSGAGHHKNVGSASKIFCSTDGTAAGQVLFTDSTCSTFASAQFGTLSCVDGSFGTCPSGAATYSGVGTYGYTQYANKDCTGAVLETSYFANSVCLDSQETYCGAPPAGAKSNLTIAFTSQSYSDDTQSGLCTGTPTYTVWAADSSCISGKEYSCSLPTPGGGDTGAASSVSASLVALVFAALVALFGARL